MQRRDFIAGLAGTAWSWSAHAQATARRHHVGMLDTSLRDVNANFHEFEKALLERGYVEGRNLTFEYRSAGGHNESFAAMASELARLKVDVIVTRGTPAALAAKAATATIPVVMAAAGDPLGIVGGPARPTANMTGFGASTPGTERKRLEVLKDMLPNMRRVATLTNLSNPSRRSEWNEIEAGARALGIESQVLDIRTVADIERSFASASGWPADALVVGSDTLVQSNQGLVVRLAAAHRVPAIYTFRDFVDAGGLVSLGVSLPDLYRRAAAYVDRILAGMRPGELPIEPPSKFDLVLNLKAARAMGLAVPTTILSRADEVIQ